MRRRVPHIPQRRVIFVGCEGRSECGYAGLLQDIANEMSLAVHIRIEELHPGAGDPLARIQMLVDRLQRYQRTRVVPYARFALIDADQAELDPQRAERAVRLAREHDIELVWQRPTLEAVLLRHLSGRAASQPPDAASAQQALVRDWPEYAKPMTALALKSKINLERLHQAAAVEPRLAALLRAIGLLD